MQRTVLVVDDVPEVVKLVAGMLRPGGYEVVEATGGLHALRILQARPIDVLVTDVKMPGVSGPEVVRRAWEFAPDLPVVFITGYAVEDDIPSEILSRSLLLTKPFLAQALRDAITRAIHRRTGFADS